MSISIKHITLGVPCRDHEALVLCWWLIMVSLGIFQCYSYSLSEYPTSKLPTLSLEGELSHSQNVEGPATHLVERDKGLQLEI